MIINEIFYSLQGEGSLAGVPSIFIRLAGCPLRCTWCDTKYAWDSSAGQEMSCEQILEAVADYPTRYVVLTGGEPMVHEGEALFHIGRFEAPGKVATEIENFHADMENVPGEPFEPLPIA